MARRERIVIPTHRRSHVTKHAMADWFAEKSAKKNCPHRDDLLAGVPLVYDAYIMMSAGSSANAAIEYADEKDLEAVASLIGRSVDKEQSLVDWIESHGQSLPDEAGAWYEVCTAAGWLVIQTYFREQVSRQGGE